MLAEPAAAEPQTAPVAPPAATAAAGPGTAAPATATPGEPSPSSGSLDAFSLAKGIAADQLSSPGKVLGLVAAVACVAYWAGRRSAFRMLRLCGRL
jgi:hypothetical protein